MTLERDTGPFVIIPEWVLAHPGLSPRAVQLYGVLCRFADADHAAFPKRQLLTERLRCSSASLTRAVEELTVAGAVTAQARVKHQETGEVRFGRPRKGEPQWAAFTTLYTVRTVPPSPGGGRLMGEPRGSAHGRADVSSWVSRELEPQELEPLQQPLLVSEADRPLVAESLDGDNPSELEAAFAAFWEVYPRRVHKRAAALAYERALKRAPADVILAGAERWRDDPNRVQQFTDHASKWLNADAWLDEPLPERGNGQGSVSEVLRKSMERARQRDAEREAAR